MYLENVVFDAVEPQALGRFWETALGCERLTDEPEGFETRLTVDGGPVLDLCFQRVPQQPSGQPRLRLVLACEGSRSDHVERLLGLGARPLAAEQSDVTHAPLLDPEGNPFDVLEGGEAYAGTGPVAAIRLDTADPEIDAQFWAWLTGWVEADGVGPHSLRHPSQRGPLLELRPESAAKGTLKNRVHLDVRLESGDDPDAVEAAVEKRGGRRFHPQWGDLPWRHYTDPSGNEFCVLPAPQG